MLLPLKGDREGDGETQVGGPDSGNAVPRRGGAGWKKGDSPLSSFFLFLLCLRKKQERRWQPRRVGWRAAGVSMLTFADRHFCSLGIRK